MTLLHGTRRALLDGKDVEYLLRDEFTTALAAGAVDGTLAEPGPGTRTVVDTDSKLSISSSAVALAPDASGPAWGDPGLWFEAQTRVGGLVLLIQCNISVMGANGLMLGFDTAQTGIIDANGFFLDASNNIIFFENSFGGIAQAIGAWVIDTDYQFCLILRSTGVYYFIKGGAFTNWTFLWKSSVNNTSTLFPAIINNRHTFTSDYIRIPDTTFLPTPLLYDDFTAADGARANSQTVGPDGQITPQRAYIGTGTIVSNQLGVVPVAGGELIVNGAFAADTDWTKGTDWSIAGGVAVRVAGAGATNITQTAAVLTTGGWFIASWDIASYTAGTFNALFGAATGPDRTSAATFTSTNRADTTASGIRANAAGDADIDNVSFRRLTLSTLIHGAQITTLNTFTSVEIIITDETQVGLMLRLDDPAIPTALVHIYTDRVSGDIIVADVTGTTTYTVRSTTAFTYSAGATLKVDIEDTNYRVYYNDVFIVSGTNISTLTGIYTAMFATDVASRFNDFTIFPKGSSNNEYRKLDEF